MHSDIKLSCEPFCINVNEMDDKMNLYMLRDINFSFILNLNETFEMDFRIYSINKYNDYSFQKLRNNLVNILSNIEENIEENENYEEIYNFSITKNNIQINKKERILKCNNLEHKISFRYHNIINDKNNSSINDKNDNKIYVSLPHIDFNKIL
jgi:hypothetical protein